MSTETNVNIIRKFCETSDIYYLEQLPKEYQLLFQKASVAALNKENANKKLANIILNHFKIHPDGKRLFTKIGSIEKAQSALYRMSISATGARKGDILIGTHKGTEGAILKVFNNIPPSENMLNRMRPYKDIWSEFLLKMGSIEFFKDMSIKERELWLDIYESKNDYFEESDRLQLIQPGIGDFNKKTGSIFVSYLPEDDLNKIMSTNKSSDDGLWAPRELNDIIIDYTGKTSTLVVLKAFWKVSTGYKVLDKFNGPVLDVKNGRILSNGEADDKKEIIVVNNILKSIKLDITNKKEKFEKDKTQSIGFLVSKKRIRQPLQKRWE